MVRGGCDTSQRGRCKGGKVLERGSSQFPPEDGNSWIFNKLDSHYFPIIQNNGHNT